MNAFDAMLTIANAVNDSAKIKAFCDASFDGGLGIYVDVNPDNAPEVQHDAPMVQINSMTRHRAASFDEMQHLFLVAVIVPHDRCNAEGYPVNIHVPKGCDLLHKLGGLVEQAISKGFFDAGIPADFVPVDPDSRWGGYAQGVFYGYQINLRDLIPV